MNQDQHYVPKTYLKRFVNDNKKIFTLRNDITTLPQRIKEFSPKATGYRQNFYTIKEEEQLRRFGLQDPNFIEKQFSKYLEQKCNVLIDRLISSSGLLPKDDAVELTLLLLFFKQRNPALRKSLDNKQNIKAVVERRWQEVIDQRSTLEPLVRKHDNKSFEEFLEYGKQRLEKFINNPDTPTNAHTQAILRFLAGQSDTINEVAAMLLNSAWILFESTPNTPFITSDNPGFCVDSQQNIHNLNFSDIVAFCFPLSPQYCLVMTGTDQNYSQSDSHKPIYQGLKEDFAVKQFNESSFKVSYTYVYSNDENALRQAWQDIQ